MNVSPRSIVFCFLATLPTLTCFAQTDEQKGIAYFEKHVRPLLADRCLECHSNRAKKTVGGNLYLDSRPGWEKGGDLGRAIVPGDPANSLLIKAVSHSSDELEMPPDARLSDQEIAILTKWIEMGAPDPRDSNTATSKSAIDLEAGKHFWAFQPPDPNIQLPNVQLKSWPLNEIDCFILSDLEKRKLQPASPADKRTLIRRATFDLTGLPPTPDEVATFLADESPDAYAKLIERLLASEHYGEHWGRHWLDVARYADSNGLDENIAHGNAWRYRDYVIQSFNEDKPFDRFVLEQLAGDLLPESADQSTSHDPTIATGFLSLGPKVLAEVDETKMQMDIIDEQVETVGRAFMGLTLGCARCHDHKFDPIRTYDYYAMAGIFKSTKTMEHFTKIARWNEATIASPEETSKHQQIEQQIAEKKQQIDALVKTAMDKLKADLGAEAKLPDNPETQFAQETQTHLKQLRDELKQAEASLFELPTTMAVADYETPADVRIHVRGSHLTQGDLASRGFPQVLVSTTASSDYAIAEQQSGRLQLAQWLVDSRHPLTSRVFVNRVWRWHFGRGIVESTDDFGKLGGRPRNQMLLDWLALQFIENSWSVKQLHRQIMLSNTYQMSSQSSAENLAIDPENHYQWRFQVNRLPAESIRDALLVASGLLDNKMGGSMLHVKNREFLFDHTSKDETKYDSTRRSVYLPVIRNHLYDVFQLFDYSDASVINSNRVSTTVAPQALFMLNSDLVNQASAALAQRILAGDHESDRERLDHAYQLCFARLPSDTEADRDLRFLKLFEQNAAETTTISEVESAVEVGKNEGGVVKPEEAVSVNAQNQSPQQTAWQMLCHTLFASNEFIYLR